MKKATPAEDETVARDTVDLLRQHRLEQLEKLLDTSISNPNTKELLSSMAEVFPAEEPKSVKVVAFGILHRENSSIHNLTLEYEYEQKWLLADVSIKRGNALPTIASFRVTPIPNPLESINSFGFAQKSVSHYIILALAIIGPTFCIYVLIVCLRTKSQRFKWLWGMFILFGVGRLAINWTTGEMALTPFALHIPCASATEVPAYGPWVVSVSLPLGAILFLLKKIGNLDSAESPEPSLPRGTTNNGESPLLTPERQ